MPRCIQDGPTGEAPLPDGETGHCGNTKIGGNENHIKKDGVMSKIDISVKYKKLACIPTAITKMYAGLHGYNKKRKEKGELQ